MLTDPCSGLLHKWPTSWPNTPIMQKGQPEIRKTFVKNLPIMHYPCLLRIINTLENNHLSQATPFDIMSEQRCRTNYCHGGADMWATPSRARNALRSDTNTLSTGLAPRRCFRPRHVLKHIHLEVVSEHGRCLIQKSSVALLGVTMGYVSNVLTKFGILSSFLPSLSLSLEIHHHFPKIRRCSNVTQCHGFQLQNMFLRGLMQYFWASALHISPS